MTGGAVGTVVASQSPDVPVGTTVLHFLGWREYALADADAVQAVDPALAPPQAYPRGAGHHRADRLRRA